MSDLFSKLRLQKTRLELDGYKVAYICIYGSQNYGLDVYTSDYKSDIDMKAIIVPTLDDLVNNSNPISKVINTEWGQCDVKDIRVYTKTLLKANPAYLETLFTDYEVVDENFYSEFYKIFALKDELVFTLRAQFAKAIYGMMLEKQKAMCHSYPTIADKIEKYGYDGKQVSHAYRLWLMMYDYFKQGLPLSMCLRPSSEYSNILIDLKLNNVYSLNEAKEFMNYAVSHAKDLRDEILDSVDESKINYWIKDEVISLSREIIKNKIISDIKYNY